MEIDINKIKDERLTEDEKMELIADYLENGGGGGGEETGGVLLHSKISDLIDSSGYSIYADPDRTTPLTRNELSELLFGIFSEGEGGMVANKVPKSAWLYSDDSLEAIYKVLGGFYDDMNSGFLIAGLGSNKLAFYRVYNDPSDGDTIFRAEKLTSLS